MGIQEIRNTLNNYCGVNIYRDGFRVYPYGQRGNDWLTLDIRSRLNPVMNLANNQIIAAIKISRRDNPNLRDRSTREGMVLNEAHSSLEKWFKYILSLLEEQRYRIRPRRRSAGVDEPLFEAFDLRTTVQRTVGELGKGHKVAALIQDTEKQVTEGVERLQEVFSRLSMSAGLGHMVDIVIHEIGSPLGKINRQLLILERQLFEEMNSSEFSEANSKIGSIKGWLEQIHNLRQRLEPQTPAKRGRATTFDEEDRSHQMSGVLIYTASGDSEGTLGGLVRQGEEGRLERVLVRALRTALWCSSDPTCVESSGQGPDSCNLAACHACALLPETSCEEGNRLLDRAMVVGSRARPELGFFSDFLVGLS